MALKRLCPRCQKVINVDQKFCDDCQIKVDQYNKQKEKSYDKNTRRKGDNKKYDDFYKSTPWLVTRAHVMDFYDGIDVYEYFTTGKIVASQTVHHIIELKEDFSKCLSVSNMIPMTLKNHSKIHLLYKRNKVVYQKLMFDLIERYKREVKGIATL